MEKIYVQDKMRGHGTELFAWLEHFVCNNAYLMAKDVDKALYEVIAQHGGLSEQQMVDSIDQLKNVKDVY